MFLRAHDVDALDRFLAPPTPNESETLSAANTKTVSYDIRLGCPYKFLASNALRKIVEERGIAEIGNTDSFRLEMEEISMGTVAMCIDRRSRQPGSHVSSIRRKDIV
jgi:hypothetical protein